MTELRGCAGVPGLLLSLGCDGGMRLWDVAAGVCLAELSCADITTAVRPGLAQGWNGAGTGSGHGSNSNVRRSGMPSRRRTVGNCVPLRPHAAH